MTDKLDPVMPKIAPMLRMLSSDADGEVVSAVRAVRGKLASAGLDIHALVERIENPPLSPSEMQKIHDVAYAKGHADGVEQGRRGAGIATAPPTGMFAGGDVGRGVNGHPWLEIAQHCVRNAHLLSARERNFVETVVRWRRYNALSWKQAKWLRDIFRKRLAGKIE